MKIRIGVEDKLTYRTEIIVELARNMSEDELNVLLDKAEIEARRLGPASSEDIAAVLEGFGCEVKETISGYPNSPDDVETEIFDYVVLKDDEY